MTTTSTTNATTERPERRTDAQWEAAARRRLRERALRLGEAAGSLPAHRVLALLDALPEVPS